jgi:hypothetical protein
MFVVGLMLALAVPSIALAANTATFSSVMPASGSSSKATMPKISVTVYDKYGVSGSANYSMTINGSKVAAKIAYVRGWGTKKFVLSFQPTTALLAGGKTVAIRVHDLKHKTSTKSWGFTVLESVPPVTMATPLATDAGGYYKDFALFYLFATDAGSGVAHTYYRLGLDGVVGEGVIVRVDTTGPQTLYFWSVDALGNVETAKSVTFTVAKDMLSATWHNQTTAFCTQPGCHFKSLTVEHYQHTVTPDSSVRLSCPTCHSSEDSNVVATIAAHSDSCTGCHTGVPAFHAMGAAGQNHALPDLFCVMSGCHGHGATNVADIHASKLLPGITGAVMGCASCHDNPDHAATTDCRVCHGDLGPHGAHASVSSVGNPSCTQSTCHGTSGVVAIHKNSCVLCHDPSGTGSVPTATIAAAIASNDATCEDCHISYTAVHNVAAAVAGHDLTDSSFQYASCFTNSQCHAFKDVSLFHIATPRGCTACHGRTDVVPLTKNCATVGCHPNFNATHNNVYADMAPTNASRHSIAGAPSGVRTKFDGSQGVTLQWQSEASVTIAGTVAGNAGTYTVGETGTVTTTWSFPTVNVFWGSSDASAPASAIKGLTKDSVITCFDCHSGSATWYQGPHGASAKWLLDANYPGDYSYAALTKYVTANLAYASANIGAPSVILDAARYAQPLSVSGIAVYPGATTGSAITSAALASTATVPGWVPNVSPLANRTDGTTGPTAIICAKCHDLENLVAGGVTGTATVPTVEGSNTAHDSHHQDQLDGSSQCVNCHVAIPHGWRAPRLLVNTDTDVAPYKDAKAMGTTAGTVGANGFNGIGMQELSGVNNHILGGSNGTPGWQPYATGTGLAEPSLNQAHNGTAYWDESQCKACGDHPGENAPAKIVYGN